ncbi:MAG TPA: hypothetical protein VL967_03650 [Terracidiphilus sp.]|nr:hypothetical protein [Terracidiphilus sp.]
MRRALAIFLALAFGLGPCTALLQADEDARLPFCCRRHGAHHCAMSDESPQPGSTAQFTNPSHCPLYPGNLPATTPPLHALAAPRIGIVVLGVEQRALASSSTATHSRSLRARFVRGPPSSLAS